MILVGNQRGGANDLALHLMKEENERVQLHELRGFAADDLQGAFQESYAISRGTRCKQHLYSLSLSPPKDAKPDSAVFLDAVNEAEKRLGLEGQPRAIVFHEKKGRDGEVRRHAHAVWCRIDMETMKAKQISFDRSKLNNLARDLYLEHNWQMPRGFVSKDERNPRNYTLAEWQQAKRADRDPDALKRTFQDAYAISDGKAAFAHALEEKGFILSKGDRRGFVAVDFKGEVYSLSRWVGKKPKELKAKLGSPDVLPSVTEGHERAAQQVADRLKELELQERAKLDAEKARIEQERLAVAAKARAKEAALRAAQEFRAEQDKAERAARVKTGLRGFWQKFTGERRKFEKRNTQEAEKAKRRDDSERTVLHREKTQTLTQTEKRATFIETRRQANIDELKTDRKAILKESFAAQVDADSEADKKQKEAAFRERRRREPRPSRCQRSRDALEP